MNQTQSIVFICPECEAMQDKEITRIGETVQCDICKKHFTVPEKANEFFIMETPEEIAMSNMERAHELRAPEPDDL